MKKTKSPINRVGTPFIHVKNLQKSASWYANLLGKEEPSVDAESPVHHFQLEEGDLLLDDDRNNDPDLLPIFMLHTEDIDDAHAFVQSNGGKIVREIERFPDVSFFNFQDPEGNILMICQQHR